MHGTVPVALPWVVIGGSVRLVTPPRVLLEPMRWVTAVHLVRAWLVQPVVVVMEPGQRFPNLLLGYLEALGTAGNLTTDAHLAALAVEHQAEPHRNDADFTRFSGLRWRNPLA